MMIKILSTLLLALSLPAFAAEYKGDVVFLGGSSNPQAVADLEAHGFRVYSVEEPHAGTIDPSEILAETQRKLIVIGSGKFAREAIEFSNTYAPRVAGLILLEPQISGGEVLVKNLPVFVQRFDQQDLLKRWVIEQKNQGRNLRDVGYSQSADLNEGLSRRLNIEFANAALAGSLKRVVP